MGASNAGADVEKTARLRTETGSTRGEGSIQRTPQDAAYDSPDSYGNLDELSASFPVQILNGDLVTRVQTLEDGRRHDSGATHASRERRRHSQPHSFPQGSRTSSLRARSTRQASNRGTNYDFPDNYGNLDELVTPSPVQNLDEGTNYLHTSLEEAKSQEYELQRNQERERRNSIAKGEAPRDKKDEEKGVNEVSRSATQLYVISYLVFFSFLGTLARLGLQAITFYTGAPVVFSVLWANFGGSLLMGFLSEDRMLFKEEWGTPTYDQEVQKARNSRQDDETASGFDQAIDLQAAKKAHSAVKKTIPLYIGLATGFCGCFTSFSSFIRDAFLALSNDLPTPLSHPADYHPTAAITTSTVPRNGGYSFMALLAVLLITITSCLSALHIGAHLAIFLEPVTPSLPFAFCRKFLDRLVVPLAWGCWVGATILTIFPPDRSSNAPEAWRGRASFALVFAPLGCLSRFYFSIYLNSRLPSFPLGTFTVNILGTLILGMSYDLQHVPLGGVVGCQVLQGVEDGFCGCLTTVSTWVAELGSLRRRNAYAYGAMSVFVALGGLVIVMGSVKWSEGFSELLCSH